MSSEALEPITAVPDVSRETSPSEQPAAFDLPDAPARNKPDGKKPAPKRTPRRRTAPAKKVDIKGGITGMYATVGMVVAAIPSGVVSAEGGGITATQAVGTAIVEQAAAAGEAWAAAADANPKIREALEKALAVNTFGALIAAHVPIAIVVGVVTGVVPPQLASMFDSAATAAAPSA